MKLNLSGLNFNQFLDLIIDKQDSSKDCYDEIQTVFKLFDYVKCEINTWIKVTLKIKYYFKKKDNSEHISIENLRRACIDTNLELTETELKEMITEVSFTFKYAFEI